jgi:hypothetical protein
MSASVLFSWSPPVCVGTTQQVGLGAAVITFLPTPELQWSYDCFHKDNRRTMKTERMHKATAFIPVWPNLFTYVIGRRLPARLGQPTRRIMYQEHGQTDLARSARVVRRRDDGEHASSRAGQHFFNA